MKRMKRGPAGRQGRPFPTFAMSHYNRDGSAVHCLARSEVQVGISNLACNMYDRVYFVQYIVLVHKQLRCASDLNASARLNTENNKQQRRNTYFCFFSVAKTRNWPFKKFSSHVCPK